MSSKQSLTITQALEDKHCKVVFWNTSTDVIVLTESPHSFKGTARHLSLGSVWDLVGSQCPRCDGEWKHSSDGLRHCATRGCYTTKQSTGYLEIANNKTTRADENVNIPPTESDIMSEPREEEREFAVFDLSQIIFPPRLARQTGGNKNE